MDASYIPPAKRYVLLDNELADMIEDINTDDLRILLEIMTCASDQECSCGKRAHITITSSDGHRFHLVGRLRRNSGEFM